MLLGISEPSKFGSHEVHESQTILNLWELNLAIFSGNLGPLQKKKKIIERYTERYREREINRERESEISVIQHEECL